jgi:hypothetical protein
MVSFHVLIATTGRTSLTQMLQSLQPQLEAQDHLTIVYDGCEAPAGLELDGVFKCQVHLKTQIPALGFWGHGIRNVWSQKLERTEFVLHADDDDQYVLGAFDALRRLCKNPKCLYIARYRRPNGDLIPPFTGVIRENYVGTPCGVIPYDLNVFGAKGDGWLPRRGGDGKFYEKIAKKAVRVQELEVVIYQTS